jgi:hypothetical protein
MKNNIIQHWLSSDDYRESELDKYFIDFIESPSDSLYSLHELINFSIKAKSFDSLLLILGRIKRDSSPTNEEWIQLLQTCSGRIYSFVSKAIDGEEEVHLSGEELMAAFVILKQVIDLLCEGLNQSDQVLGVTDSLENWMDSNFEKILHGVESSETLKEITITLWKGNAEYYSGSLDFGLLALNRFVELCPSDKIDNETIMWMKQFNGEYSDTEGLNSAIRLAAKKGSAFQEITLQDSNDTDFLSGGELALNEVGKIIIYDDNWQDWSELAEVIGDLNDIRSVSFSISEAGPEERYLPAFLDKLSSGYLPTVEQIGLEDSFESADLSPWLECIAASGVYVSTPTLSRLIIDKEETQIFDGDALKMLIKSHSKS